MAGSNDKIAQIVVLMLASYFLDNVLAWLYAGERPQRFVGADTTPSDQGLQTVDSSTWYDGRMIPAWRRTRQRNYQCSTVWQMLTP